MLDVTIHADRVQIGRHFSVAFERTLRIPDDGRDYPLPPVARALPRAPRRRLRRPRARGVARARRRASCPMYQREAMWLSFQRRALAAERGQGRDRQGQRDLRRAVPPAPAGPSEDYVVVPRQPWLDGINAGNGFITPVRGDAARHGLHRRGPGHGRGAPRRAADRLLRPEAGPLPGAAAAVRARGPSADRSPAAAAARARRRRPRDGPRAPAAGCASRSIPTRTASTPGTRTTTAACSCTSSTASCGARSPASRSRRRRSTPAPTRTPACRGSTSTTTASATSRASDVLANVKSVAEKDAEHGFVNQQDDSSIDVAERQARSAPSTVPDGKW